MTRVIFFILALFITHSLQAELAVHVTGKLLSYNDETVTLEKSDGKKIQVPRKHLNYHQRTETSDFLNKEIKVVLPYLKKSISINDSITR